MNPTARVHGIHMLDTLMALGMPVKALFAAEHGFRGNQGAGEIIQDGLDEATGLPVFSLYGETKTHRGNVGGHRRFVVRYAGCWGKVLYLQFNDEVCD